MSETIVPVEIVNKHLIANFSGACYLLDTGSPCSFGKGTFEWDGEEVNLETMPELVEIETINSHTNLGIAGLIGSDLLLKRDLTLDLHSNQIIVHDAGVGDSDSMQLKSIVQVPLLLAVDMCGRQQSMYVDTGAMQTFISEEIASGLKRVGTVHDFLPIGGSFEADLVEIELIIGREQHKIEVAVATNEIKMLAAIGIDGIVGLDVLQRAKCTLSYSERAMSPYFWFEKPTRETIIFLGT